MRNVAPHEPPTFDDFFVRAMGDPKSGPIPYQRRLAEDNPFPSLLDIPTGLGKTAAAVLAWLWRRRFASSQLKSPPRRLVYCLPMRVLVEQTRDCIKHWLTNLGLSEEDVGLHVLMGGEERSDWRFWPERDAILIGTQDMLLSRALNRGYAAGRARWPMEFGLLNNDCLWVFDEVQLMSTGLATSLQLDAWRRFLRLRNDTGFFEEVPNPVARPCQSLWMSATMARHWLDSAVDWHRYIDRAWNKRLQLEQDDFAHPRVKDLFSNNKDLGNCVPAATLEKPRTKENKVDPGDAAAKTSDYISKLAARIRTDRSPAGLTLVILNTVDRAVRLYGELQDLHKDGVLVHLVHSRFRPMERENWTNLFSDREEHPRVIVSTQVVEAGIDISAKVLFTELAPWASMVQRFGRCARFPGGSGRIFWMDAGLGSEKQPIDHWAKPYEWSELVAAREQLQKLGDVDLQSLRKIGSQQDDTTARRLFPYNPRFVPRDKDLFDLFDTTPDLTGADVDVSRFIRDDEELDVQVFWRKLGDGSPTKRDRPQRKELCPVAFYRFKDQVRRLLKRGRVWRWNYRSGWELLNTDNLDVIYPGQSFLLEKSCGGYDRMRGWTGDPDDTDFDLLSDTELPDPQSIEVKLERQDDWEGADDQCQLRGWLSIHDHSRDVCRKLEGITRDLLDTPGLKSMVHVLYLTASWHDRGKAHEAFAAMLKPDRLTQAQVSLGGQPAAKAPDDAWRGPLRRPGRDRGTMVHSTEMQPMVGGANANHAKAKEHTDARRPGFRHELASALALLETLRLARPNHQTFAWPSGLEKSDFGQFDETFSEQEMIGPAVEELDALNPDQFDLVLYLVAAHHGKVRMSLRSSSDDSRTDVPNPCPAERRQARGVRDEDALSPCKLPGANWKEDGSYVDAPTVSLNLDLMELGLSPRYGRSWRDRMQDLLERLGPFWLAYLEGLLRAADCRASEDEYLSSARKDGAPE